METATLHLITGWCVMIYANTLKIDSDYNRKEYLFFKIVGGISMAFACLHSILNLINS